MERIESQENIAPTYVIGDIHGELKKLVRLLRDAHVIGDDLSWIGGQTTLWFLGDFVDRGPDGIAVIDLVMRLQSEAEATGGGVASLMGNHELLLLAAYRFGRRSTGLGSNFLTRWKRNGGNHKDIAGLTPQHLTWLMELPLMALAGDHLLMHADATFYMQQGRSVEEVNAAFKRLLKTSDALMWEEFQEDFGRRGAFLNTFEGQKLVDRFLDTYGGQHLAHGHTPISSVLRCAPKKVTDPLIYAQGRCINVDGGMCLGGPGFVYRPAEIRSEQPIAS